MREMDVTEQQGSNETYNCIVIWLTYRNDRRDDALWVVNFIYANCGGNRFIHYGWSTHILCSIFGGLTMDIFEKMIVIAFGLSIVWFVLLIVGLGVLVYYLITLLG